MRNIGVRMVVDDSQKVKFQSFATAAERAAADVNSRVAVPFYRAEMALNRIGGVATRTAAVGFGVLTTAVGGLTYAMAGLGKEFISVNERFTNLQITLTSALRSFKAGRDIVRELAQYTAKSPLPFQALAETVQSFSVIPQTTNRLLSQVRTGSLGRSDGFLKQALDTVSSMNVFRPDQSASSAVFAIREALGGQLRSLVRRFDIPTTLLQRSSGLSTRELQRDPDKMFDAIYKLFTDIVTPEATYQFARQPTKLLANTREQLVDIPLLRIGQGTGELGASSPYNRLLTSAQRGFDTLTSTLGLSGDKDSDKFEEKFGKRVRNALTTFFDRIEGVASKALDDILDKLGVVRNENRVERVIGGIVQGMEKLFTFAGNLADKLQDIGPSVLEIFERIFGIAGKVFDGLLMIKDKFGATAAAGVAIASPLLLNNLGSVISLIVRDLPQALGGLKNAVSSLFTGISQSARGIGGGVAGDPKLAAFIAGRAPGVVSSGLMRSGLAGSDYNTYLATYKDRAGDLGFNENAYKERAYRNYLNNFYSSQGSLQRIPGSAPMSDVRARARAAGLNSYTSYFSSGAGAGMLSNALGNAARKQYGMDDAFFKQNPEVLAQFQAMGISPALAAGISKEYKPPTLGQRIGGGLKSAGRAVVGGVGSALAGGAIGVGVYAAFEGLSYLADRLFAVNTGLEDFTNSLKLGSEALAKNTLTSNERQFLAASGVDVSKSTGAFSYFTEQQQAAQLLKNGIPQLQTNKISAETTALFSDPRFRDTLNSLALSDKLAAKENRSANLSALAGEVGGLDGVLRPTDRAQNYKLQLERLQQSGFLTQASQNLVRSSSTNPDFIAKFKSLDGFYAQLAKAPVETAQAFTKLLEIPVVLSEINQVAVDGVASLKEGLYAQADKNTLSKYGGILGPALLDVRKANLDPNNSSGVLAALFRSTNVDKYNQASRLSSIASNNVVYSDALDAAKAQSDAVNPFGLALKEVSDLKAGTSRVLSETLYSGIAAAVGKGPASFRYSDTTANLGPTGALGVAETRDSFLKGLTGTYDSVRERIQQAKDILAKEGDTLDKNTKDFLTTVSKLDITQSLNVLQGVIENAFTTLDNAAPATAVQRASALLDKLPDVPPALFSTMLEQLNKLLNIAGISNQNITPVLGAESGASDLVRQQSALNQQAQIANLRGLLAPAANRYLPGGLDEEKKSYGLLATAAKGAVYSNDTLLKQARTSRNVSDALPYLGRNSFDIGSFEDGSPVPDILRRAGLTGSVGGYNRQDEMQSRSQELANSARLLTELSKQDNLVADEKLKINRALVDVLKEQEGIRRSMSLDGFFDGLARGITTAQDQLRDFATVGQQIGDTIKQSLGGAFYTISGDIKNAGSAVRQFGIDVADMIRKIFAQKAAESLLNVVFGAFSGAFTSGAAGPTGSNIDAGGYTKNYGFGYATGGFTGIGQKYQYAGYVHKGEYVLPQETVRRVGVPALDRLKNSTSLPGFADGGYMPGATPVYAGRGMSGGVNIQITVHNNGTATSKTSSSDGMEGLAEGVNALVQSFFTERLMEEQRPGGMLNPNA